MSLLNLIPWDHTAIVIQAGGLKAVLAQPVFVQLPQIAEGVVL